MGAVCHGGTVARIIDFGAFVNILPGKDGWCTFPRSPMSVWKMSDHLRKVRKSRSGAGRG